MMVRRSRPLAAFVILASSPLAGCYGDIELQACTYADDPTGCSDGPETAATTSTSPNGGTEGGGASGGTAPTTGEPPATDGATTMTATTASETSEPADDPPPWIAGLACDPEIAEEVGPTLVTYTVSADAVEAELLDDGVVIATAPAGEPFVFPVISAATNNPGSLLTVRVRDGGGQTAEASVFQPSTVLPPGEIWKTIEENDGKHSMGAAVALQNGLALAGGVVWDGMQILGMLRQFDKGGKWLDVPGAWSKPHPTWTGLTVIEKESLGPSALAVDADGFIVLAATAITAGGPRMYVARFFPNGELVWELLHNPGTEARGVGVKPDGTIYVTGGIRTNVAPERWDMATWVYAADKTAHGVDVFGGAEALDEDNLLSERGRGVAVLKDGRVAVVGDREVWDPITNAPLLRGVVLLYEAKGILVDEWTSTGDLAPHDALLAVTATDDGLAACGYVQADPNAKTQLVVRWFDDALQEHASRLETSAGASKCNAIGYNREGWTIVGGSIVETGFGANAWIFAVEDATSPLLEYLKLDGPAQGADSVTALACDYTCAWTGSLQVGNQFQWITGMFRG